MAKLSTRIRNLVFALGVFTAAGFATERGPIFFSAEECARYCANGGYCNSSWDPETGNCRCW